MTMVAVPTVSGVTKLMTILLTLEKIDAGDFMSESKNKKHTEIRFSQTPSSNAVNSMPEDSYDIINKYGRCISYAKT